MHPGTDARAVALHVARDARVLGALPGGRTPGPADTCIEETHMSPWLLVTALGVDLGATFGSFVYSAAQCLALRLSDGLLDHLPQYHSPRVIDLVSLGLKAAK